MTTVLIVYHSQGGNTRRMAEAVAEGVRAQEGVDVRLLRAEDAGLDDLSAASGLIIGSPEYFGYMAGRVKDFFDRTYEAARGRKDVFRKPYALFVSAGNDGSGAVRAVERIALGYPLKKVYEPVVAKGEITPDILEKCRELGQTLAAGCDLNIY
jgi:multimeric flavodoxin WrbA